MTGHDGIYIRPAFPAATFIRILPFFSGRPFSPRRNFNYFSGQKVDSLGSYSERARSCYVGRSFKFDMRGLRASPGDEFKYLRILNYSNFKRISTSKIIRFPNAMDKVRSSLAEENLLILAKRHFGILNAVCGGYRLYLFRKLTLASYFFIINDKNTRFDTTIIKLFSIFNKQVVPSASTVMQIRTYISQPGIPTPHNGYKCRYY